jgi:signal transduction histidine kinase
MAESLQQRTAELKTALRELDARRRQEIEMQEEFLSKVSHELRTPLAVVHQCASILADGLGGEISPRQREFMQITLANVTHLESMIEELLDAASSQNGKLAIRPSRVAVPGLVQEVLNHYQYTAQKSGLALSTEITTDLPTALADARRLRQILANLIENSIKFTQGPGTITVRAGVSGQDPHFVQIAVSDTGCGIDPEEREKVFGRHYQIAGSVSTSRIGLGLGLYICRELVALHGGRIWIDSHRGQGCTVTFTLPIFESDKIPSADITK